MQQQVNVATSNSLFIRHLMPDLPRAVRSGINGNLMLLLPLHLPELTDRSRVLVHIVVGRLDGGVKVDDTAAVSLDEPLSRFLGGKGPLRLASHYPLFAPPHDPDGLVDVEELPAVVV